MRGREIIETEGGATDDELNDSESSDSQDESQLQGRKSLFTSTKAPIKSVKNRQRVLLLSSRGIIQRYRHLLNDLHTLLPHSKKEAKLDTKSKLFAINELAEISNCNNALFLEVRKHKDLYLWMSKTPNGPSVKFNVLNGIYI